MQKPEKLYHGSNKKIEGPLQPILLKSGPDHIHTRPAVFATERADVASLFMMPTDAGIIYSVGFEQDVAYVCIWGTREDFVIHDHGGYLYILPSNSFEKIGKEYEWQSFEAVEPIEVKYFESVIPSMMEMGVQVYFINDDGIFDTIHNNPVRMPTLKTLLSENQKSGINIKTF